jgi:molecular chaperone DnaK (HSP70)
MIIKYARSNAEKQIKEIIKDVVITVPSYWNIKMRAFII